MADAAISGLTAVTTPAATDELPVNQGGTSKKLTLAQVNAYCEPLTAQSTTAQGPGFAADTYVTGSGIVLPLTRIQAGTQYSLKVIITKTAAGVAAPTFTLRCGTAGSTADAATIIMTGGAQTAAVDTAILEADVTFRAVGASSIHQSVLRLSHNAVSAAGAGTGFSVTVGTIAQATSSTFNGTGAGLTLGLSMNGGTSAAWTVTMAQARLFNVT